MKNQGKWTRLHHGFYWLLIFGTLLPVSKLKAQELKSLTSADYPRWGTLSNIGLSGEGDWSAFKMSYTNADTLWISHTRRKTQYCFAGAWKAEFLNEKLALVSGRNNELYVLNLLTGHCDTLQNVTEHGFFGKDYFYYLRQLSGKSALFVSDDKNTLCHSAENVTDIAFDKGLSHMAYIVTMTANSEIWHVPSGKKLRAERIAKTTEGPANNLTWQDEGLVVVFTESDGRSGRLHCLQPGQGKEYVLDNSGDKRFAAGNRISPSSFSPLAVSADGKRVFFAMAAEPSDSSGVGEVWGAADKHLFIAPGWDTRPHNFVWWPEQGQLQQLTDSRMTCMMLNGTKTHAIVYDPLQYEPQSMREAPADLYLWDLENDKPEMWLRHQEVSYGSLNPSPAGKYILYKKDSVLWSYEIASKKRYNLLLGIAGDGFEKDVEVVGWRERDQKVLVSIGTAIWEVAPDGRYPKRISPSVNLNFRLLSHDYMHNGRMNFNGPKFKGVFNSSRSLLLEGKDNNKTVYFLVSPDGKNSCVGISDRRLSQLQATRDMTAFSFLEEDFDLPPRLYITGVKAGERILFQSNLHHWEYNWGHSKLVKYQNSNGEVLSGALFYPAGYKTGVQYPMVVHVYQVQSDESKHYVNPSEYNPIGFNIANLSAQGYFVFLPDIVYRQGKPGLSATDCILSGISAVLKNAPVDTARIGLLGHSFGGYEAAFILTQTDIFRVGVIGSAITDFNSSYLYVNPTMQMPNFWKYEYGQLRMGTSLFEDPKGYYENSPVYRADKITTPLLSWAGKEDMQVHYFQSMEMYLALRRLGKEHVMLLYPEEGHTIQDKETQSDLTRKTESWLNYHLKGSPKPLWVE